MEIDKDITEIVVRREEFDYMMKTLGLTYRLLGEILDEHPLSPTQRTRALGIRNIITKLTTGTISDT